MAEHFGALALPVGEFLALEHGTEFVGYRRITVSHVLIASAAFGGDGWRRLGLEAVEGFVEWDLPAFR